MKKEIDFIGIGTIKSGTSFLADLLMQHPDVLWASKKEVNYFNKFHIDYTPNELANQPLSFYYSFFQEKQRKDQMQGEFSPIYINEPQALRKIAILFPEIKIIVVLRNPVERTYSHFLYAQNFRKIIPRNFSFANALNEFPFLKTTSLYAQKMEEVYSIFSRQNVKTIVLEELAEYPVQEIGKVYEFLDLAADFRPVVKKINASKEVKHHILDTLYSLPGKLKTLLKSNQILGNKTLQYIYNSKMYQNYFSLKEKAISQNTQGIKKTPIQPLIRSTLEEYYREDILSLENLLDKDLSLWKK